MGGVIIPGGGVGSRVLQRLTFLIEAGFQRDFRCLLFAIVDLLEVHEDKVVVLEILPLELEAELCDICHEGVDRRLLEATLHLGDFQGSAEIEH